MLDSPIATNIVSTDMARTKKFYVDILGLRLSEDFGRALHFDAGGSTLIVYEREAPPKADHTVASWMVPDIAATAKALTAQGVRFEIYDGFEQDADGIASRGEDGPKIAWFKDPDGNILALMQAGKA